MSVENNNLINQICVNSKLEGVALEAYKARLQAMSEAQLQAELTRSQSSDYNPMGLMVEREESDEEEINFDKNTKTYTTAGGDQVTDTFDFNDKLFKRVIVHTEDNQKVIETVINYKDGKPVKKTVKENGNTTESTSYETFTDDDGNEYTEIKTDTRGKKISTRVKNVDENGEFKDEDFIIRETRSSMTDELVEIVVKSTKDNKIVVRRPIVTGESYHVRYNGSSITDYDNGKLKEIKEDRSLRELSDKVYTTVDNIEQNLPTRVVKSQLQSKGQKNVFAQFESQYADGVLDETEIKNLMSFIKNVVDSNKDGKISENEIDAITQLFEEMGVKEVDFRGFLVSLKAEHSDNALTRIVSTTSGGRRIITNHSNGRQTIQVLYPDGDVMKIGYQDQDTDKTFIEGYKSYVLGVWGSSLELSEVDGESFVNAKAKVAYSPRYQRELETFALVHFEQVNTQMRDTYDASRPAPNFFSFVGDLAVSGAVGGYNLLTGEDNLTAAQMAQQAERNIQNAHDVMHTGDNMAYYSVPGEHVRALDYSITSEQFQEAYRKHFGKDFNYSQIESFRKIATNYETATELNMKIEQLDDAIELASKKYRDHEIGIITEKEVNELREYGFNLPFDRSKMGLQFEDNRRIEYMLTLCRMLGKGNPILQSIDYQNMNDHNWAESLKNIQNNMKGELNKALDGHSYEALETGYRDAYKEIYGVDFNKHKLEKLLMAGTLIGQTTEMAVVMALTSGLAAGLSAEMAAGVQAAQSGGKAEGIANIFRYVSNKYGQKTAENLTRLMINSGFPVINTVVSYTTAGSEEGREAALDGFKDNMVFGLFGSYVSGPIGDTVKEILRKNPAMVSRVFAYMSGLSAEVTADTFFETIISGTSITESFGSNAQGELTGRFLNMLVGAHTNRTAKREISKALGQLKINQEIENGEKVYIVRQGDTEVFKTKDPNEIAQGVMSIGLGVVMRSSIQSRAADLQGQKLSALRGNQQVFTDDMIRSQQAFGKEITVHDGYVYEVKNGRETLLGQYEPSAQRTGQYESIEYDKFNELRSQDPSVKINKDGYIVKTDADGNEKIIGEASTPIYNSLLKAEGVTLNEIDFQALIQEIDLKLEYYTTDTMIRNLKSGLDHLDPKQKNILIERIDKAVAQQNAVHTRTNRNRTAVSIETNPERQKAFISAIENPTELATALANLDFNSLGKDGLPLQYTRDQFNHDVEALLSTLTKHEAEILKEFYGLVDGAKAREAGFDAGFDGMPNNREFVYEGASEKLKTVAEQVRQRINQFTVENTVRTGNPEVDKMFTTIIRGLPEFTSVVGKKQHGTHAYSVDLHTLHVLKMTVENPLFATLPKEQQKVIQIAALLHDTGKKGGVVDTGHAELSEDYTLAVLDKFDLSSSEKAQILDLVKNHHWFEAYNKNEISAEDVAKLTQDEVTFTMYEILAKADLASVKPSFHLEVTGSKNETEFDNYIKDKMKPIHDAFAGRGIRSNGTEYKRSPVTIAGLKADNHFSEESRQVWENIKNNFADANSSKKFEQLDEALDKEFERIGLSKDYKVYVMAAGILTKIKEGKISVEHALSDPSVKNRMDFLSKLSKQISNEGQDGTYRSMFYYGPGGTVTEWRDPNNAIVTVLNKLVDKGHSWDEISDFINKNKNIVKNSTELAYFFNNPEKLKLAQNLHTVMDIDADPGTRAKLSDAVAELAKISPDYAELNRLPDEVKGLLKNSIGKLVMQQGDLMSSLVALNKYMQEGKLADGSYLNINNLKQSLKDVQPWEMIQILGLSNTDGWFDNAIDLMSTGRIKKNQSGQWEEYGRNIFNLAKDSKMYSKTKEVLTLADFHDSDFTSTQMMAISRMSSVDLLKEGMKITGETEITNYNVDKICMAANARYLSWSNDGIERNLLLKQFYEKYSRNIGNSLKKGYISDAEFAPIAKLLGVSVDDMKDSNKRAQLISHVDAYIQNYTTKPDEQLHNQLMRCISSGDAEGIARILRVNGLAVNIDNLNAFLNYEGVPEKVRIHDILVAAIRPDSGASYRSYIELQHMGIDKEQAKQISANVQAKSIINNYNIDCLNQGRNMVELNTVTSQKLAVLFTVGGGLGIDMPTIKNMKYDELLNVVKSHLEKLYGVSYAGSQENFHQLLAMVTRDITTVAKYQESLPTTDIAGLDVISDLSTNGVTVREGRGFQGFIHSVGLLGKADMSDLAIASTITATGHDGNTLSSCYISDANHSVASNTGILVEGQLIAMLPFDAQFYTRVGLDDISAFYFPNGLSTINGLEQTFKNRQYMTSQIEALEARGYTHEQSIDKLINTRGHFSELTMSDVNRGINNSGAPGKYNEGLLYDPEVKAIAYMTNSPDEQIPQELMDFARARHLDIVLLRNY